MIYNYFIFCFKDQFIQVWILCIPKLRTCNL